MPRFKILPELSTFAADARSSLHPIHVEASGLEGWFDTGIRGSSIDPDVAGRACVELAVDLMRTGNRLYDRELERKLEVRKFPTIVGEVRSLRSGSAADRYWIDGEVRVRGVSRPVETEVTIRLLDDGALRIRGEHEFDVRDFGLDPPRFLMIRVHPEVRVRCSIVAEQEG